MSPNKPKPSRAAEAEADADNSMSIVPVTRKKLSAQVLDQLLLLFHDGTISPGDELPSERELMARFQVGRPSVREAMQNLAQAGLIEIRHGGRARAVAVTPAALLANVDLAARYMLSSSAGSLDHLQQARQFFEAGMVRIAAAKAGRADLERLEVLLEEQRASLDDHGAYLAADMAFHQAIAAVSGNPIFASLSDAMLSWLREHHVGLVSVPGASAVSLREHRLIFKHIAAGDADKAERALLRHLKRSSKLYRSFLGGS